MKTCLQCFVYMCLSLCFGSAVKAQQTAPGNAANTAISSNQSKLAVLDTEAFYDPDSGIARLIVAGQALEQEFQPRRTELQGLQQRIQALTDELNRIAAVTDPKVQQEKREQLQTWQRELKHKTEDAEEAYRKRLEAVFTPLLDEISKALDEFAQQRGLAIVLDASKLDGILIYVAPDFDLTRVFIADYNQRHPAAAPKQ